MDILKKKFSYLTLSIAAIFAFGACSNPTSSEEEDHASPFGVAMILNGVEIAVQENGEITYNDGDHLELDVGEETNLITVRWISEDGDRFVPNENEGYSLSWVVDDENVLEVEQHEEDGAWEFHLVGLSDGESNMQLELFHNDHSDFTSLPFEVHVEQAVSGMAVQNGTGNDVLSVDASGTVTGSVELTTGETTEELTAVFFDEDGNEVQLDEEYELKWHIESGSEFLTINESASNALAFTLTGVAQGQATMHFELVKEHGDHDHDHLMLQDEDDHDHGGITVYESPDITVTVN